MTRKQFNDLRSCMRSGLALVLATGAAAVVLAQAPAAPGHHDAAAEPAKTQASGMMADQKAMMAAMAAADQKLTELVARMNAAKGDDKVTAIAAVVTELVAQHQRMHGQMRMPGGMMNKTTPPAEPKDDHSAHHPQQ